MQTSTVSHYRILEKVGSGGMGEVFKAEDLRLRRVVALKLLPPAWAANEERRRLLLREARMVAQLDHPHICGVYEVDEAQDGGLFLAMPYYAGESLTARLVRGELAVDRALVLGIQLSEALAAAHAHGIVHRDVKPSNVLITASGDAKLLDFGLAVEGGSDPETAETMGPGTLRYMSPEQVRGEAVDHRTDLWSLGATLYEALAGHPCFTGADRAATVRQILHSDPPPLRDSNPRLAPAVAEVIERCLTKEPDRRPRDAAALLDELRGLRDVLDAATRREVTVATPAAADGSGGTVAEAAPRSSAPAGSTAPGSASSRASGEASSPASSPASGAAPRLRSRRWRRGAVVAAALLVAAASVALVAPRLGLGVAPAWMPWDSAGAEPPRSLMVLPFANLTGDPGFDYLGDGLASGLVGRLSEVAGVRIVGRFLDAEAGRGDEAARLAGASRVLAGDVQSAGDVLRITARLTDSLDGTVLWAESFEGTPEGIFGVEHRIASGLTDALGVPLSSRDRHSLERRPTESQDAYRLYLRARRSLGSAPGSDAAALAERQLLDALRLDPGFALAHAALSEALWRRFRQEGTEELARRAATAAEEARRLDPDLPEARVALARVQRATGSAERSISGLEAVLAEHPRPAEALRELARSYRAAGELEEAERCFRQAVHLAPDDWSGWNNLGSFLTDNGDYRGAADAYRRAARLAPPSVTWPQQNLAAVLIYQGDRAAAVEAFEGIGGTSGDPVLLSNMATAWFFLGDLERAEELYRRAVALDPDDADLQRNLGDLYQRRGAVAEAEGAYRRALELVEAELAGPHHEPELAVDRAVLAAKLGNCGVATGGLGELWRNLPRTATTAHGVAQAWALCGQREEALQALEAAIGAGWPADMAAEEDEFRSLAHEPRFRALTGG